MTHAPDTFNAEFSVGQLVYHVKFGYRGVVVDVDPCFQGTDEWYEEVAQSKPPKDQPWYHVLVHDLHQRTYVAQRHLIADTTGEPIDHPDLNQLFSGFEQSRYTLRGQMH